MENPIYILIISLIIGVAIGFASISISIIIKSILRNSKGKGFRDEKIRPLRADRDVLSQGRNDYSSKDYK